MNISESVIVITGASSGIGLASARLPSSRGANVVLAARDAGRLRGLQDELPGSLALPTDVTDDAQARRLVERAVEECGRIDVLVNCAGRAMFAHVEDLSVADYQALIDLNVVAPLRLMQLVIPQMRRQGGGTIVNVSSQASKKYIPNVAGYASTKHALKALSLTARAELEGDGIVVCTVYPGVVDTDFGSNTAYPEPEAVRRAPDGSLLPHVISPSSVAEGIGSLIESGEAELDVRRASALHTSFPSGRLERAAAVAGRAAYGEPHGPRGAGAHASQDPQREREW